MGFCEAGGGCRTGRELRGEAELWVQHLRVWWGLVQGPLWQGERGEGGLGVGAVTGVVRKHLARSPSGAEGLGLWAGVWTGENLAVAGRDQV